MDWQKLEVGRQVCKQRSPEENRFDIFPFGLFLMFRISHPDFCFLRNMRNGHASFQAVMADGFLIFLARIGMIDWQPFIFHMSDAHSQILPQPWPNGGLPLHITVVDAHTGFLVCKRVIEIDPLITQKMLQILKRQSITGKTISKYIFTKQLFQRYSITQLVALSKQQLDISTGFNGV